MHSHRIIPSINAGSMADIAFLLLIFFLVTTTLDQEIGIQSILPPLVKNPNHSPIPERNVLEININGADKIQIENKPASFSQLRGEVNKFYTNPHKSDEYPKLKAITTVLCDEKISEGGGNKSGWLARKEAVKQLGTYSELPAGAVISIKLDRSTSYATYILVQNELTAGLNHLRDSCAMVHFGVRYASLNASKPEDQKKIRAIRLAFPSRISEAEPVDY